MLKDSVLQTILACIFCQTLSNELNSQYLNYLINRLTEIKANLLRTIIYMFLDHTLTIIDAFCNWHLKALTRFDWYCWKKKQFSLYPVLSL